MQSGTIENSRPLGNPWRTGIAFGVAALAAQLIFAALGYYGFHRVELLYLEYARHLAWGYSDTPPFPPAFLRVWTLIFGDSLLAIHLPAALALAATVTLGAPLTREFGGGRWAQSLTCLALFFAPYYLSMGSFYSPNAFDCLFWIVLAWLLARIINTDHAGLWLPFGAVAGLALMTKYTAGIYLIVLLAALLLTKQRSQYMRVLFWIGMAIAFLITVPNLIWQFAHGWPSLDLLTAEGAREMHPAKFSMAQIMWIGPAAVILCLAGLGYDLAGKDAKRYRVFPIFFIALFILFSLLGFDFYYLAAAYPPIIALGAVCLTTVSKASRWLSYATAVGVVVLGIALAPNAAPIIPAKLMVDYQWISRMPPPVQPYSKSGRLGPALGDRMGWQAMAEGMARSFGSLPDADKQACVILTSNRFEAAALNHFGPDLGLPPAITGDRNGYLWGPGGADGSVVLTLGEDRAFLEKHFDSVTFFGHFSWPYVMAYQDDKPVFLCRGLKEPMDQFWPELKRDW